MVRDVYFIIPTDHKHDEAPDMFEMFKTIVAWPQSFVKCSAIISQFGIDRDIRSAFLYAFLAFQGEILLACPRDRT